MENNKKEEHFCTSCGKKIEDNSNICDECFEKKRLIKAEKTVKKSFIFFWILLFINFFVSAICFGIIKGLSDNPHKSYTFFDFLDTLWFALFLSILPCAITYSDAKKLNKKGLVLFYRILFIVIIVYFFLPMFIGIFIE